MTDLPAGLRRAEWSTEKLQLLWTKVKDYDRLFSDETRGDPEDWAKRMLADDTVVLETTTGLLVLSRIQPGRSAEVHAIFFDQRLSAHTSIVRDAILWAFLTYNFERLEAHIPKFSRALRRWMCGRLGFKLRTTLKNDFVYRGEPQDSLYLTLSKEDVIDG